jgi:hypothetical protein
VRERERERERSIVHAYACACTDSDESHTPTHAPAAVYAELLCRAALHAEQDARRCSWLCVAGSLVYCC